MLTADVTAEEPGIGCILKFSSTHFLTNIKPGSEIVGVPASEINEIILFFFIISIILLLTFFFVKFMIWLKFIFYLKVIK